jgi:deoxyribodipyrimidine photolyase
VGKPEQLFEQAFGGDVGRGDVFCQTEITWEEKKVDKAVRSVAKLHQVWGRTLHHIDDLTVPPESMGSVFTHFRNAVEKKGASPVRPTVATLKQGDAPALTESGKVRDSSTLLWRFFGASFAILKTFLSDSVAILWRFCGDSVAILWPFLALCNGKLCLGGGRRCAK